MPNNVYFKKEKERALQSKVSKVKMFLLFRETNQVFFTVKCKNERQNLNG